MACRANSDGEPRDGAQVAELPGGCRHRPSNTIAGPRTEGMASGNAGHRPPRAASPGAQLRLTDHNGWRITCFATNTRGPGWTLPVLEVRHRQRARCEDRIRALKDTGLRNLPFHDYAHNRIWVEVVALAADLLAWTQTLACDRARARPTVGTQTTPIPDPRRRRTHRAHRPTTTATTAARLALEPPHRHRLDRSAHRLKPQAPHRDNQDWTTGVTAPAIKTPAPRHQPARHQQDHLPGSAKHRGGWRPG